MVRRVAAIPMIGQNRVTQNLGLWQAEDVVDLVVYGIGETSVEGTAWAVMRRLTMEHGVKQKRAVHG